MFSVPRLRERSLELEARRRYRGARYDRRL
jgi:hypothetical protein